ncbi:MAG: methylated-DNA--[protein]-cysteine S-methyltransferase [Acidiferrobacter sp.]
MMTSEVGMLTVYDVPPGVLTLGVVATPIGALQIAVDHEGVPCFISRATARAFRADLRRCGLALGVSTRLPVLVRNNIAQAFAGPFYEGPVNLAGLTPFQRQVLVAVHGIARGAFQTYGDIARALHHPRAARAVGTALARNPLPFLIPCHRVVAAGGHLGAYSAGGQALKRRLLKAEGVDVTTLRCSRATSLRR